MLAGEAKQGSSADWGPGLTECALVSNLLPTGGTLQRLRVIVYQQMLIQGLLRGESCAALGANMRFVWRDESVSAWTREDKRRERRLGEGCLQPTWVCMCLSILLRCGNPPLPSDVRPQPSHWQRYRPELSRAIVLTWMVLTCSKRSSGLLKVAWQIAPVDGWCQRHLCSQSGPIVTSVPGVSGVSLGGLLERVASVCELANELDFWRERTVCWDTWKSIFPKSFDAPGTGEECSSGGGEWERGWSPDRGDIISPVPIMSLEDEGGGSDGEKRAWSAISCCRWCSLKWWTKASAVAMLVPHSVKVSGAAM